MTTIGHDDLFDTGFNKINKLINKYPNASIFQTQSNILISWKRN